MSTEPVVLVGRSNSHFTRVTRIVAIEHAVEHEFRVLRDLLSRDAADYGGNPALRVPTLRTPSGLWFGAGNIARELARRSRRAVKMVWTEEVTAASAVDAQELVLESMATEVTLIMGRVAGADADNALIAKRRQSLLNMLEWLEQNLEAALAALPRDRDLSYLEVTLFCLITHLDFRQVVPVTPYAALGRFREGFEQRPAARLTEYRFDT